MAENSRGTVPYLYDQLRLLSDQHGKGHTFLMGAGQTRTRSFAELAREAGEIAGALQKRGLHPGARVGLLIADNADFIAAFFACVHAGLVAVPLSPPPALGKSERFFERIALVLEQGRLGVLITDDESHKERLVNLAGITPVLTFESVKEQGQYIPQVERKPDDLCFIQFTSGSTGKPKGVVVDYRNVAENCRAIAVEGLRSNPGDVCVSWLPMYHDMGLVGKVLATFSVGMPCVYIPTRLFVRHPNIWMQAMSEFRGTITFAPNFALKLAVRRLRSNSSELNLSHVRAIGCGAEPISAEALRLFSSAFEPFGLSAHSLLPSYGMAEATLAVSFASLDVPPRCLRVRSDALTPGRRVRVAGGTEAGIELVSCGAAFDGHKISVVGPRGEACGERQVGEIVVEGPSVAQGYWDQPEETRNTFDGMRLVTGDLGFLDDGELFVCGRKKELIIINGVNFYPQDIEWSLEGVEGIREGGTAAFGCDRGFGEELVVVVERARQGIDGVLRELLKARVLEVWGLMVSDVAMVSPGDLPRTTSGKLRRGAIRSQYQREISLVPLASWKAQVSDALG